MEELFYLVDTLIEKFIGKCSECNSYPGPRCSSNKYGENEYTLECECKYGLGYDPRSAINAYIDNPKPIYRR